jgi:hypothetical protein
MSLIVDGLVSEGIVDLQRLRSETSITALSASTQSLNSLSNRFHVYTGAIVGQIVKLPDATTLQIGHEYWLLNEGSVNMSIQDNAGGPLALVAPDQRAVAILYGTASAAGEWALSLLQLTPGGTNQFEITYPGTGLAVNYTGGNYRQNGVLTQISAGAITLPASTTGTVYVDIDGIVKATASIPADATPLYNFVTSGSAVTTLLDVREEIETNLLWGVLADIIGETSGQAKAAGTSEKYARADHVHGNSFLKDKAGVVTGASFSGSPKKYVVVFSAAFADADYAISLGSLNNRSWTYESKTAAGFTINANANTALSGEVSWSASKSGESA